MSPRNRRMERALNPRGRGAWIATVAVVLVGLIVLWFVFSPGEQRREELVERVRFGDDAERVASVLGPAPARCAGGTIDRLRGSFPADWAPATAESVRRRLEQETGEVWVYPLAGNEPGDCEPGERDTVIGLSRDGRVLWTVALVGRTPLRTPPGFESDTTGPDGAAAMPRSVQP